MLDCQARKSEGVTGNCLQIVYACQRRLGLALIERTHGAGVDLHQQAGLGAGQRADLKAALHGAQHLHAGRRLVLVQAPRPAERDDDAGAVCQFQFGVT